MPRKSVEVRRAIEDQIERHVDNRTLKSVIHMFANEVRAAARSTGIDLDTNVGEIDNIREAMAKSDDPRQAAMYALLWWDRIDNGD